MKLQKSFVMAVALALALPLAYADDSTNYVNGGIGDEGMARMHSIANEYPLHIIFSEGKDGAFLADIPVTILDRHHKAVVELPDAGPLLYVRLPKGKYTVNAEHHGVKQSRSVTLDGKHAKSLIMHWADTSQEEE